MQGIALFRLHGRERLLDYGRGVLNSTLRPGINAISRPRNNGVKKIPMVCHIFLLKWSKHGLKDHI